MTDTSAEPKKKTNRLRNLRVHETSGVDHPAHMHPGWLVMKSADTDTALALLGALGKERNMTTTKKEAPVLTGLLKSLEPLTTPAEIRKAISEADSDIILKEITEADIAPVRDQIAELWKVLRDLADKGSDDIPSVDSAAAPVDMSAVSPEQVLASAELQKAMGPAAVDMLKAMHANSIRIEKELEAERERAAIAKAKADYGDIMEDDAVEAFAKAMRAFEAVSSSGAAAVHAALAKSKELNESAEAIITKEIGGRGAIAKGSPLDRLQTIAKALVEAGTEKSPELAFAKACELNPDIYSAYRAGEER